jgi:glycine cleavage system H protein
MSQIPNDRRYATTHQWIWLDEEQPEEVLVGMTEHAQQLLGDIVFIETPQVDLHLSAGEHCGVFESVKAASDLYTPISGTIIDVNHQLMTTPDLVNSDPYGEGWIFRVKVDDEDELDELMDASEYESYLEADLEDDD